MGGQRHCRTDMENRQNEEVYLKAYESITEARVALKAYFEFFNCKRRHQGLDRRTPNEV
jgi:putative transposase